MICLLQGINFLILRFLTKTFVRPSNTSEIMSRAEQNISFKIIPFIFCCTIIDGKSQYGIKKFEFKVPYRGIINMLIFIQNTKWAFKHLIQKYIEIKIL